MDLRQLRTFCVAAKTLNFSRAAEMLSYAQSSVTAQIQSLEEELGARLFERLGRRLVLTAAGERLLEYGEEILRLAGEAQTAISSSGEPSGNVSIGSVESLCTYRLPPLLRAYRERFPKVRMVLSPSACADLPRGLKEGRFDVAFCLDRPIRLPHLVSETLMEEELVVLAHPDHPLTAKASVSPLDLAGDEVLLLTEEGCSYRALFEQALLEAGVRPAEVGEFGSVEAIKQCAMAGMGIAVLPRVAVRAELNAGRLRPLAWRGPIGPLAVQIVYHREKWISPALRALIETAREVLGSPPRPKSQDSGGSELVGPC